MVNANEVITVLEVRHTAAPYDPENILRVRFSGGWTSMKDRKGRKLFELLRGTGTHRTAEYTASEAEAVKADLPREWRYVLTDVTRADLPAARILNPLHGGPAAAPAAAAADKRMEACSCCTKANAASLAFAVLLAYMFVLLFEWMKSSAKCMNC